MMNINNEILKSSPKLKLHNNEKLLLSNDSNDNFPQNNRKSISFKKPLNNMINKENIIIRKIINKKLPSLNHKTLEKVSINKLYLDYLNTLNNIKNKKFNSIDDLLNSDSKTRINTQIKKIANKLYDNTNKIEIENENNTINKSKPDYFHNVLNKKVINNFKLYINSRNYPNYDMGSKSVKTKKIYRKNLFNLSIKELQKLYYDIDSIKNGQKNLDENNKYITKNRFDYGKYASNKNIFNHPKLYVLDTNKNNKLPKIQTKANEINMKLNYIKKNEKSKIQEEYFNFIYNTLNK